MAITDRLARLVVTGFAGLLIILIAGTTSAVAQDVPEISADVETVAAGDWLTVQLAGFPQGPVQIEFCGGGGAGGSLGCDLAGSSQVQVDESGTGSGMILLSDPPAACPCVIVARSMASATRATLPVPWGADAGAGQTELPTTSDDDLEGSAVLSAAVIDPIGRWHTVQEFFGLSRSYRLSVDVVNVGGGRLPAETTDVWLKAQGTAEPELVGQLFLGASGAGDHGSFQTEITVPAGVRSQFELVASPYEAGPPIGLPIESIAWGLVFVGLGLGLLILFAVGRGAFGLMNLIMTRSRPAADGEKGRGSRLFWLWPVVIVAVVCLLSSVVWPILGHSSARAAWTARQLPAGAQPADVEGVLELTTGGTARRWPVRAGGDHEVLRQGIGDLTAGSGTAPILLGYADQPGAPFESLSSVAIGDKVTLRRPDGVRSYAVTGFSSLPAGVADLRPADDAADSLTLVSAERTPASGSTRLVVRAVPAG